MNVASLLAELIAAPQAAISSSVHLPVAETPQPTFQASLLAAQSKGDPLVNSTPSSSDTRQAKLPSQEEKKNESSTPITLPVTPEDAVPQPASAADLIATTQNPERFQFPMATAVVAKEGSQENTGDSIARQLVAAVSSRSNNPGHTAAHPSSSTSAVTSATSTITQKSSNSKRQSAVSNPTLTAHLATADNQTPVVVASAIVNQPVPVDSIVAPTPSSLVGQGNDVAATYPVETNSNASKDNNPPVPPVYTAAPTFVQTDIQTATVAGAETPSIPAPSLPADTIAHGETPSLTQAAPASDPRVPVSTEPAVPSGNVPASPNGSSNSTAHAGAPAATPETTAKPVPPARPAANPVTPATQPVQTTPSPVVANIGVTAVPLVTAILQPVIPVLSTAKTVVAPVSGKASSPATTNASEQTTGIATDTSSKTVAHAASDTGAGQSDGQSASQQGDPTQSSVSTHSQSGSQAENTSVSQIVTGTDHSQGNSAQVNSVPVNSVPAQPAAGTAAHDTRTPDTAAPTATPVHQAPEINTARLIQSVGQSEMRVGLRSTEFGNISIHTSTTRDLVSTQISLDHDELAKMLTTHLPEIQAKLGGTQPAEVRIDMNGQAAGQQPGQQSGQGQSAPGGTASGSREQSSQQPAKASAGSFAEVTAARPSAGLAHLTGTVADRRLDITV